MNQILLTVHFIGLGLVFTGAAGAWLLLRQVQAMPAGAPVLAKLQPTLLRAGDVGLALLWITGPWMVATKYSGNLPGTFWLKFLCVVAVTAGVLLTDMTAARVRAGSKDAGRMLPLYVAGTGVALLLVIVFAVITFD